MDPKLTALVADQIALEQYSAALYLSMASAADTDGLFALASDLLKHADEEQGHARRWVSFLFDRGAALDLQAVEAPPGAGSWGSLVDLCGAALKHEERITAAILAIRNAAMASGDTHLEEVARAFLREQTEEEDVAQDRLAMARVARDPAAFDLLIRAKG